jgi:hypothetical protein
MPTDIGNKTRPSGETVWVSDPATTQVELWRDGTAGTYKTITPADYFTAGGVTSPKTTVRNVFSGSRTVDQTFFNIHVYDPGNVGVPRDIDYYGVRLHDVKGPLTGNGIRWHNWYVSPGNYNFQDLYQVVDPFYAAGKAINYMWIGNPDSLVISTPNTGKYDNGGNFKGSNQPLSAAGRTELAASTAAFATAFNGGAHGKVTSTEYGNENNYTSYNARTFAQYVEELRIFRNAWRSVDSSIKVVAPTIQEPEGTGYAWLTTMLSTSDGASGTGKDHVDVGGCHLYPPYYNFGIHGQPERSLQAQVPLVRAALDAAGLTSTEIWNTETGVLADPARTIDEAWKARMVKRSLALCAAMGVKRYFWYTYDNPDMSMSSLMKDAWQEVRGVLLSGAITNCNVLPDETVCITVNGQNYSY